MLRDQPPTLFDLALVGAVLMAGLGLLAWIFGWA